MTREKEKQYAYRAKLMNAYQIGETESWFTDMAAEGLHLEKAGLWRFRFQKGEPQRVNYRIDYKQNVPSLTEAELAAVYQEYGWEYVTKFGEFRVFRSPEEARAPELHTDPAEQALALRRLEKKLTWLAAYVAAASIIIAALFCAVWLLDATPVLHLVEDQTLQQAFLLIVYIYLVINSVWEAVSLRRLCASLREGRAIDHRADWRKSRTKAKAMLLVILLLEIPVLAVPAIRLPQLIHPNYTELPAEGEPQPFVRLADIEKSPDLVLNQEEAGTAYGNRYEKQWGIFASAAYDVQERGEIPERTWADGSGIYSPSLTSKLYSLRIQALARPLAKELVFQYRDMDEIHMRGGSVGEPEDSRFDYAVIVCDYPRIDAAAARGNLVMSLTYYGEADADRLLDLIDEKLSGF